MSKQEDARQVRFQREAESQWQGVHNLALYVRDDRFGGLVEAVRQAQEERASLVVSSPNDLGDNLEEVIQSLSLLAETGVSLVIEEASGENIARLDDVLSQRDQWLRAFDQGEGFVQQALVALAGHDEDTLTAILREATVLFAQDGEGGEDSAKGPRLFSEASELLRQRLFRIALSVEQCQQVVRQGKDELLNVAGEMAGVCPPEEIERISTELYWDWAEVVSVGVVAVLLGCATPNVARRMGTRSIVIPCSVCKKSYELIVNSRTHRENVEKAVQGKKGGWIPQKLLCPECQEVAAPRWEVSPRAAGEAYRAASEAYRQHMAQQQARMDELRRMPYDEYLRTLEWKETRQAALKRAGDRCQVCNTGRQAGRWLEVHHRTYERRGREWSRDLIVLCNECHKLFHLRSRVVQA